MVLRLRSGQVSRGVMLPYPKPPNQPRELSVVPRHHPAIPLDLDAPMPLPSSLTLPLPGPTPATLMVLNGVQQLEPAIVAGVGNVVPSLTTRL